MGGLPPTQRVAIMRAVGDEMFGITAVYHAWDDSRDAPGEIHDAYEDDYKGIDRIALKFASTC